MCADTLLNYAAQVKDLKRQKIVQIFAKSSPILTLLNFIDLGDAMGYEYDRETALPGIGFRAINGTYPAQNEGLVVPVKEGTAIMGGLVQTDWQLAQNSSRKASRVAQKVQAAGLFFTRMFFDGNTSVDAKQFDGLNARIGTGPQRILAGADGAALDLDAVCYLSELVVGQDEGDGAEGQKVYLMSTMMRRQLAKIIRSFGRSFVDMADWAGPYKPTSFNGIPIKVVGRDDQDNFILGFNEVCGGAANTGSIYCVSFGQGMDEDRLQAICKQAADGMFQVIEQGVRLTQDLALVEGRVGLATFHPRSIARYQGILPDIMLTGAEEEDLDEARKPSAPRKPQGAKEPETAKK